MSMELNPATRAAPAALPPADPAGRVPGPGETPLFASDLAQWMAGAGEVAVPSAAESALEDAIEPEPEEQATDPVAMLWLALGLPAPTPLRKGAAMAATEATAAAPGLAAEAGDSSQDLAAILSGSSAEPLVRGPRATPSGPVMPSLPATAAETARSALATAFAKHIERFAAEPARGAAPPGIEALVPAPRAPDAPTPPVGVPVIERLAAVVATITPAAVIDPRLPQAPQQIAETVIWNLGKGAQEVRIHLNPEDLGPLDLNIKLDGDRVAVRFDLPDASLRDVVQSSLPNLAALLGARGLALDQAQVFTQQGRGQAHPPAPQSQPNEDAPVESVQAPRASLRRGLVDDYV